MGKIIFFILVVIGLFFNANGYCAETDKLTALEKLGKPHAILKNKDSSLDIYIWESTSKIPMSVNGNNVTLARKFRVANYNDKGEMMKYENHNELEYDRLLLKHNVVEIGGKKYNKKMLDELKTIIKGKHARVELFDPKDNIDVSISLMGEPYSVLKSIVGKTKIYAWVIPFKETFNIGASVPYLDKRIKVKLAKFDENKDLINYKIVYYSEYEGLMDEYVIEKIDLSKMPAEKPTTEYVYNP